MSSAHHGGAATNGIAASSSSDSSAVAPASTRRHRARPKTDRRAAASASLSSLSESSTTNGDHTHAAAASSSSSSSKSHKAALFNGKSSSSSSLIAPTTPAPAPSLSALPRYLHPLHRCRFSTSLPSSIISLSFSPSGRRIAVGRSNGNIELWRVCLHAPSSSLGTSGWVWIKTVPGSGDATVQVLLWTRGASNNECDERLLSAGLNGRLIEWDLNLLAPKYASDTYGGAAWCGVMHDDASTSSSSTITIALGCEDGTIRLFDLTDAAQPPLYLKSLVRHNSRILSLAYSPCGAFLASGGSDGMIKVWDLVNGGRNIQRIAVENKGIKRTTVADSIESSQPKKKQKGFDTEVKGNKSTKTADADKFITFIWSISFLSGGTLMSGDSIGNVQVWDLEFGTLLQSFPKCLAGDVLTIVVNNTRDVAYAAGVEGKIVELKAVGGNNDDEDDDSGRKYSKWVVTANHRQHTHDVYALALSPNALPIIANKQSTSSSSQSSVVPTNNHLLVSGGVDTQLLLSPTICFPEYHSISRLLPFPQTTTGIRVADKVVLRTRTVDGDVVQHCPPRFLVTHEQHLQLYGLGSIGYDATVNKLVSKSIHVRENDSINLEKGYTHLLDINVNCRKSVDTSNPSASIWVSGGGLNLICSALSADSSFIACSDPIQVKLYRITSKTGGTGKGNQLMVKKIKINHLVNPASALTFSADSTTLFVATLGGPVQILDLTTLKSGNASASVDDDEEEEHTVAKVPQVQTLIEHIPAAVYQGDMSDDDDDDEDAMTDGVTRRQSTRRAARIGLLRTIAVSADQLYLTIGDELNHIWVYDLDSMRLQATLPIFAHTHLTMSFHPHKSTLLAILCERNTLYMYDVESQRLTDYTKANLMHLTSESSSSLARDQFTNISFDSSTLTNANSMMLQSINHLLFINLDQPRPVDGVATANSAASSSSSSSSHPHLNRRDRKRKAEADEAAASSSSSSSTVAGVDAPAAITIHDAIVDPLQKNYRLITRFRPMLFGGFVDESSSSSSSSNASSSSRSAAASSSKLSIAAKSSSSSSSSDLALAMELSPAAPDAGVDPNDERKVIVGSSMLVVEAPWLNILQQLPQPMARHRYGT